MAVIGTVTELLHACSLDHVEVDQAVTLESLMSQLEISRPVLLNKLREAGVAKLNERQALANCMGKAQREGRLIPSAAKTTPTLAAATVSSLAPVLPPPPKLLEPAPATDAWTGGQQPAGVLRWLFDTSTWSPTVNEWELLLSLLPAEDAAKTMKFVHLADRKRAIVSRLLQRAACAEVTGLPYEAVRIGRTKGSKPYLENRPRGAAGPNWNFNVSHEGSYVALAAEPSVLCGVDVAAPEQVRGGRGKAMEDLFKTMSDYFTPREWASIRAKGPSEPAMEASFRKHWSLKEAYTKGRGDGIAFHLGKCDFSIDEAASSATVAVEGRPLDLWKFYIQALPGDHWLSVGRGPPSDAVDALGGFTATFERPTLSAGEMAAELSRPEPVFSLKSIAELVPEQQRAKYATAASTGEVLTDQNSQRRA